MKPLDVFKEFLKGGWTTGLLDTQWKVVDGTLYFQQTASKLDWFLNFLFAPMKSRLPYKDMPEEYKVHAGFFLAYKVNAEEIQKLDFKRVAGYSRGGPLAMFALEDYEFRHGNILESGYVFGCPRFLKKSSAAIAERWAKIKCFKNPGDMVAKLPFTKMGFQDVGEQIVLSGKASRPTGVSRLFWWTHHSDAEYIQRLGAYE